MKSGQRRLLQQSLASMLHRQQHLPDYEGFDANSNSARACVPHGVLDEVSQHLRNADRIGADRHWRRGKLELKRESLGDGCFFQAGADILNQLAKLEGLDLCGQLRWVTARDGEEVAKLSCGTVTACLIRRIAPALSGRLSFMARNSAEATMLCSGDRTSWFTMLRNLRLEALACSIASTARLRSCAAVR